jgi:rhodanese-related sulfurtransferase
MKPTYLLFITLLCLSSIAVQAQREYHNITVQQADSLIKVKTDTSSFVVIDIRTQGEYDKGHLDNVILLNYLSRKGKRQILKLDKEKSYLIYCRSGGRSGALLKKMEKKRFHDVYNMLGGIKAWTKEELPLVVEEN